MLTRTLAIGFALAIAPDVAAQTDRPAQMPTVRPQPQVICGTRIVPADPRIDRQFVKPSPPGVFTLRTWKPPICSEAVLKDASELKNRLPQIAGPKR
jgi:hypothetical protein